MLAVFKQTVFKQTIAVKIKKFPISYSGNPYAEGSGNKSSSTYVALQHHPACCASKYVQDSELLCNMSAILLLFIFQLLWQTYKLAMFFKTDFLPSPLTLLEGGTRSQITAVINQLLTLQLKKTCKLKNTSKERKHHQFENMCTANTHNTIKFRIAMQVTQMTTDMDVSRGH